MSRSVYNTGKNEKTAVYNIVTILAILGVVGPIVFWMLLLLAQSLHPGYDPCETSVSRLVFDPYGWVQTVNYYLFSLFLIAFGISVYIGIARFSTGRLACLFLVLIGLAQFLAAVCRVDINPFGIKSPGYIIHNAVIIFSISSFPIASLLLAADLWSERSWRPFAYISFIAAAVVLLLGLSWVFSRITTPHFIDPYFGLFERILISIPLAWMITISIRLLLIKEHNRKANLDL